MWYLANVQRGSHWSRATVEARVDLPVQQHAMHDECAGWAASCARGHWGALGSAAPIWMSIAASARAAGMGYGEPSGAGSAGQAAPALRGMGPRGNAPERCHCETTAVYIPRGRGGISRLPCRGCVVWFPSAADRARCGSPPHAPEQEQQESSNGLDSVALCSAAR